MQVLIKNHSYFDVKNSLLQNIEMDLLEQHV